MTKTLEQDEVIVGYSIEELFRNKGEVDSSAALVTVAKYFELLANRIDERNGFVRANPALVLRFEAVYLWLSDLLLLYPDSVRNQLRQLVEEKKLCEQFAVLASMADFPGSERSSSVATVLVSVLSTFTRVSVGADPDHIRLPNRNDLFSTKIALRRLAQILRYTSSLDISESEEQFANVRDHFDPNLVDKQKVGALLDLLRAQLREIPDATQRIALQHVVERLDAEVRRPKVRWSSVIMGAFVLLGVLADLKSLYPNIYDGAFRTAQTIMSVIHEDSQVQRQEAFFTTSIPTDREKWPHRSAGEVPLLSHGPRIEEDD